MKSLYRLSCILVLPLLLFTECEKEPVIPVPEGAIIFPDEEFLDALIDAGVDTNGDGYITIDEAQDVTTLELRGIEYRNNVGNLFYPEWEYGYWNDISNIEGIEMFTNLKTLILVRKLFDSIDISTLTKLQELTIFAKELKNLDVSNNTELKFLECGYNQLTSLDVSNTTALTYLNCGGNQLTSLDVSNNTDLRQLYCRSNHLTALDISNNTEIGNIYLGVSPHLDLSDMPTLHEVCVWETFNPILLRINITGSPNCWFDTVCNGFPPGIGEYVFSEVSIYPNPTSNLLTIETDKPDHH